MNWNGSSQSAYISEKLLRKQLFVFTVYWHWQSQYILCLTWYSCTANKEQRDRMLTAERETKNLQRIFRKVLTMKMLIQRWIFMTLKLILDFLLTDLCQDLEYICWSLHYIFYFIHGYGYEVKWFVLWN